MREEVTDAPQWWVNAAEAFKAWLVEQSEEVHELSLLDQIALYAEAVCND